MNNKNVSKVKSEILIASSWKKNTEDQYQNKLIHSFINSLQNVSSGHDRFIRGRSLSSGGQGGSRPHPPPPTPQ